ncbi:MAG: hypothetical protein O3C63_09320 [Cyanobacteria bacterium]|nr:hypothetical protein [Cyanobacteriota bacterium]
MSKIIRSSFSVLVLISLVLSANPVFAKKFTKKQSQIYKRKIAKINAEQDAKLPLELANKKAKKLNGELVLIMDRKGEGTEEYFLNYKNKGNNKSIKLYFTDDFDQALINTQVTVNLLKRRNKAVVIDIQQKKFLGLFAAARQNLKMAVTGTERFLAVRVRWEDSNFSESMTKQRVDKIMFSEVPIDLGYEANSVKNYFSYHSGGDYTMTGETYEQELVLDGTTPSCDDFSTYGVHNLVQAKLEEVALGLDLDGFDKFLYIVPDTHINCGWAGIAPLGGNYCYVKAYSSPHVYIHEIGHNLKMHHAARVYEYSTNISEYGDNSDAMGFGVSLNSVHRDQMGWKLAGQGTILEAEANVAEFNLVSLDRDDVAGTRVIKIPNPYSDDFTYISYRTTNTYSYDYGNQNTEGGYSRMLSIHKGEGEHYRKTYLKKTLAVTETWTDPETGFSFAVSSANDDSAIIQFSKESPELYDLSISLNELSSSVVSPGDSFTTRLSIANLIAASDEQAVAAKGVEFEMYINSLNFNPGLSSDLMECYVRGGGDVADRNRYLVCTLENELAPGESVDLDLSFATDASITEQTYIFFGGAVVRAFNRVDINSINDRSEYSGVTVIPSDDRKEIDLRVLGSFTKDEYLDSENIELHLDVANMANGKFAVTIEQASILVTVPIGLDSVMLPDVCVQGGVDFLECKLENIGPEQTRSLYFSFSLEEGLAAGEKRNYLFDYIGLSGLGSQPVDAIDLDETNNYLSNLKVSIVGDEDPVEPPPEPPVSNGNYADMALSLEPIIAIDPQAELSYIKSGENIVVSVIAENKSSRREGKTAYGVSFSSPIHSSLEYVNNPYSDACNINQGATMVSCSWDYIPAESKKRETLIFKPQPVSSTPIYSFGAGSRLETLNNIEGLEVEDPDLGNNTHAELYWQIRD